MSFYSLYDYMIIYKYNKHRTKSLSIVRLKYHDSQTILAESTVQMEYAYGRQRESAIRVCKTAPAAGRRKRNAPYFPDPSKFTGSHEEILHKTREVRNVIKEMIQQFIEAYRNNQAPPKYRY